MLNIKQYFGDRYKYSYDPACLVYSELRRDTDYLEIPCRNGRIYAVGDNLLAFWCIKRGVTKRLALKVEELGIEMSNRSDDGECVFRFTPDRMLLIEPYARPKMKKVLSEEHKQRLRDRLREYRAKKQ